MQAGEFPAAVPRTPPPPIVDGHGDSQPHGQLKGIYRRTADVGLGEEFHRHRVQSDGQFFASKFSEHGS